ncbi:hypothetical protein LK540_21765 [Massilia sp. IC2-278]|uniref:hypothetical protein n=1 Tax=Massilia sp. IC2-278 TaxID=2887200 RepID=UPI001E3D093B|nr:hypothetical protein [Massilia sp. IC2-278]MCC2963065.1 hypothetical protein [Massilia sp. IC2-278]
MTHKITSDFTEKILFRMNAQAALALGSSNDRGRTVAEIVEYEPAQVNEVWCRNILRQLLHTLERQYAMQLPPQLITPDTVFVRESGEAILLVSQGHRQPDLPDDLTALAKVIHFAITHEPGSIRPLRGRVLPGYSNSLITAIDRSMDRDPDARPHSIEELRAILGMLGLKDVPITSRSALPAAGHSPYLHGSPSSWQHEPAEIRRPWLVWTLSASAAIVFGIFLGKLDLPGDDPFADNSRTKPSEAAGLPTVRVDEASPLATKPVLPERPPMETKDVATPNVDAPLPLDEPTSWVKESERISVPQTTSAPMLSTTGRREKKHAKPDPAKQVHAAPSNDSVRPVVRPSASLAEPKETAQPQTTRVPEGSDFIELQIQPWGVIYVDGNAHGVSPPLKRLKVTAGRHVIRVKNPNAEERVFQIDASGSVRRIAVDFTDRSE